MLTTTTITPSVILKKNIYKTYSFWSQKSADITLTHTHTQKFIGTKPLHKAKLVLDSPVGH